MIKQRGDAQSQTITMYKLIILDYSMPEIDGPRTAAEIRQYIDSKGLQMPFICCCTAYNEAAFKSKAFALGMDNFLIKPMYQK